MKRRQVILSAGATVTGGSALIGSGAFSAVSAERDFTVAVADDGESYLRLAPCTDGEGSEKPNGAYVDNTDGLLSISLSGDNGNDPPAGSGVNPEALSKFHNVFEICNQGTQSVCVNFGVDGEIPTIPDGSEEGEEAADVPDRYNFGPGDPAVIFYEGDDEEALFPVEESDPNLSEAIELDVGDCACFGFNVRAFGFDSGEDLFADTDLTIIADADASCAAQDQCATLTGSYSCLSGDPEKDLFPNGSRINISNVTESGSPEPESVGYVVINAVDEATDAFVNSQSLGPGETLNEGVEAAVPLRGFVFWKDDQICEDVSGLQKRDEWQTDDSVVAEISETVLNDGEGPMSDVDPDRYDAVKNELAGFDDLIGDDGLFEGEEDLEERIPEDAYIADLDYSGLEIVDLDDWNDGNVLENEACE